MLGIIAKCTASFMVVTHASRPVIILREDTIEVV